MDNIRKLQRAARYLRMSTEHQQYSTANQIDAINTYAVAHDIDIVATYEDAGKSGLTLAGRPALRQLIADVVAGKSAFDIILVYDVSRWGRFQDADESAHLEYLCRISGVAVEYCAEPFENDGTPLANICKVMKRTLAAEYSRELSQKVFLGKQRLAKLGYRQGGSAGLGLRRCLIDQSGNQKQLLTLGQRKSITTDRVTLVAGPPEEVAIVRRIFHDYVKRRLGCETIATALNQEGISTESGRPWSKAMITRILISEKYVGDCVWGKASTTLKSRHRRVPREAWLRVDGAFQGIVERSLFEQAQNLRASRTKQWTDAEIVSALRGIYRKHGKISKQLIDSGNTLKADSISHRFGGLTHAYALAGLVPSRDIGFIKRDKIARRFRENLAQQLVDGVRAQGGTIERMRGACLFRVNGLIKVSISVAQLQRACRGNPRWYVQSSATSDLVVVGLLDGTQEEIRTLYLFPAFLLGKAIRFVTHNRVEIEAFRIESLKPLLEVCATCSIKVAPATLQLNLFVAPCQPRQASQSNGIQKILKHRGLVGHSKSFSGVLMRATNRMRRLESMANTVSARLNALREALLRLRESESCSQVLARAGITDAPAALFPDDIALQNCQVALNACLRKASDELLALSTPNSRAVELLNKLSHQRKIAVTECMEFANDHSGGYARALSTPMWSEPKYYSRETRHALTRGEMNEISAIAETAYLDARRAFSSFSRNAVELGVLLSFVRHLLGTPELVVWLLKHDAQAIDCLRKGASNGGQIVLS